MLESAMAFIQDAYTNFTMAGIVGSKYSRIVRSQCFAFRCADDRLIGIHLSTTEKFWQELVEALGASELLADERFRTHQTRVGHYHLLKDLLGARFLTRPRGEWMALLDQSDVQAALQARARQQAPRHAAQLAISEATSQLENERNQPSPGTATHKHVRE